MPAFATRALGGKTRPLIGHPGALSKHQSNARPMLDGALEHLTCLGKAVAGIKQTVDLHAVLGSLLYFVEIAIVGIRRAIRLFVEVDVSGLRFLRHRERITRSGQEGR